jgi:hypothetical protein
VRATPDLRLTTLQCEKNKTKVEGANGSKANGSKASRNNQNMPLWMLRLFCGCYEGWQLTFAVTEVSCLLFAFA